MCSRFDLNTPPHRIVEQFGLRVPPPMPNINTFRPTDVALCLLPGEDAPEPKLLAWGLRVEWDKRPIINARAETLEQKPTFRRLLERRILVPATSYTEWRTEGRAKIPHHIRPKDSDLFAFPGFIDDDGRFTIVTCSPAPSIAYIHDRMPVVLPDRDAEARWLDPEVPFDQVRDLLRPFEGAMEVEVEEKPKPAQGELF